jgi:hypothetical protein
MNIDQVLEASQNRRMANEDKFLKNLAKREAEVAPLVGELCREGKTVYYINLRNKDGRLTGKTKESANDYDLICFMVRNHY